MAVRQCSECNELMQEGYLVEHVETCELWYYCNGCTTESEMDESFKDLKESYTYEYVDWQPHEMDDEDFSILMNALLESTEPQQFADMLDILNRENAAHYAPMGVLDQFVTYLNQQQYVYDTLGGRN